MTDHYPMPVDKDGNGPAEESDIAKVICSCGKPNCSKFIYTFMSWLE